MSGCSLFESHSLLTNRDAVRIVLVQALEGQEVEKCLTLRPNHHIVRAPSKAESSQTLTPRRRRDIQLPN